MQQDTEAFFTGKRGVGLCFLPEENVDDRMANTLVNHVGLRRVACIDKRCRQYEYKRLRYGSLGFFAHAKPPKSHAYIITARHLFRDLDTLDDREIRGQYFSEKVQERIQK